MITHILPKFPRVYHAKLCQLNDFFIKQGGPWGNVALRN